MTDRSVERSLDCRAPLSCGSFVFPGLAGFVARICQAQGCADARHLAPVAVAVSGGGDSLAALRILAARMPVVAVTVNHGLRAAAADEAAFVAREAASLGVDHHTLHWHRPDASGNLMDQARRGRLSLIAQWASARGIADVVLGHTADDQAETFVMRLARASGVGGLSGMRRHWRERGVTWHRPFLDTPRETLRDVLRANGARWIDDPSNDDPAYSRVRVRQAAPMLAELGLDRAALTRVVDHLAAADHAISTALRGYVTRYVRLDRGDVLVEANGLDTDLQGEFRRRLFGAALQWVSGADYAPRGPKLDDLCATYDARPARTLHGVQISFRDGILRFAREYRAVARRPAAQGLIWDRWAMRPPQGQGAGGADLRALGPEGLAHCPQWRDTGLPRASLMASPAVWHGDALISAPLAGISRGWHAEITTQSFDTMLFTR
ncbi:tRNA lysidine(34) synthetase TilS [Rhodobacteraceae bacterium]|nr:tRNA lysidine(34) synthetase TilS [Paracoccaceae bacterium]